MAELTRVGSKVTRNFINHSEAEAFQDGVRVAMGIFGIEDETQVVFGPILPLELKGYTTTLTIERELSDDGGDF